jgi:hypothetical protein
MKVNSGHSGHTSDKVVTVTADRLTRWTAVTAVLAVAGVAGWVSYLHCVAVVSASGEPGTVGRLYPVLIDGLIVAASMVLLDAAYHEEAAPRLAWWLLAAGIGATVTVNVLSGVAHGPLGAVAAAWPAGAFVGCYELLMMLVRASSRRASRETADDGEPLAGKFPSPVPGSAEAAAEASMRATHAAGNAWKPYALQTQFGLSRKTAAEIHARVLAEPVPGASPNGNGTHA